MLQFTFQMKYFWFLVLFYSGGLGRVFGFLLSFAVLTFVPCQLHEGESLSTRALSFPSLLHPLVFWYFLPLRYLYSTLYFSHWPYKRVGCPPSNKLPLDSKCSACTFKNTVRKHQRSWDVPKLTLSDVNSIKSKEGNRDREIKSCRGCKKIR